MADLKEQAEKKADPRRKIPKWLRNALGIRGLEAREKETHKQGVEKEKDRPDSYVLDPKKKKKTKVVPASGRRG